MEVILAYLAMPWVQVVIGLFVGWLGLPQPSGVSQSWWGKLIEPIFGTGAAATNVSAIVEIIMSLLKVSGAVSMTTVPPDAKVVEQVVNKKLTLNEAARSHKLKMASEK